MSSAESRHFDLNQNHVTWGGGWGNVLLQIPEHHTFVFSGAHTSLPCPGSGEMPTLLLPHI